MQGYEVRALLQDKAYKSTVVTNARQKRTPESPQGPFDRTVNTLSAELGPAEVV